MSKLSILIVLNWILLSKWLRNLDITEGKAKSFSTLLMEVSGKGINLKGRVRIQNIFIFLFPSYFLNLNKILLSVFICFRRKRLRR